MNWDQYFLEIAIKVASRSKCLSRQIGAVIVNDMQSIVSTGYNGPPRKTSHCQGKICPRKAEGYKSGEGLHLCSAAHAERNAIANAALNGVSTKGCTLYMNCIAPCKDCAGMIINSGIISVVVSELGYYDQMGLRLLEEAGVELDHTDLN